MATASKLELEVLPPFHHPNEMEAELCFDRAHYVLHRGVWRPQNRVKGGGHRSFSDLAERPALFAGWALAVRLGLVEAAHGVG